MVHLHRRETGAFDTTYPAYGRFPPTHAVSPIGTYSPALRGNHWAMPLAADRSPTNVVALSRGRGTNPYLELTLELTPGGVLPRGRQQRAGGGAQ